MHIWEFELKSNYYKIEFWDSRISGKKKLSVNGNVIVENNNSVAIFNYSFQIDSYYFNLVQLTDEKYDIKINNNFFEDIIKYEKSGDLQKAKIEREKKKNTHDFFPGQSINNFKLDTITNNEDEKIEENKKILNKIDYLPNDDNHSLSLSYKDNVKETGNFNASERLINEEENNNLNKDDANDYPSFSEI